MTDLAIKIGREVTQAQDKLLREWVERGLPLENADPKYELTWPDESSVCVRAWIDWRD